MARLKVGLIILLAFFVVGCNDSGNKYKCLQSVEKAFPTGKIEPLSDYRFVVKDDKGKIWYVETNSIMNPDITYRREILR